MRSEDGFSLVEILIALAVTSLLMGFAFAIYLLGQKYFIQWEQSLDLQNEIHTLAQGISEDIFRTDEIIEVKSHGLTLRMGPSIRKYYEENGNLMRDSVSLLDTDIKLVDIRFGLSNKGEVRGTGDENTGKSNKSTRVDLQLALANRQDTLRISRAVFLRKPSTWKTLNED